MAWKTADVQEQRVRFVVCACRREKNFRQLCQEFDISRPTGYQWLRRYQAGLTGSGGSLSGLDDHSRYAIALAGTWSTRAEPVRERLEEAFQRCGVPEEMLMDHGTPWWNMNAATGWTWLTVWLMRQGIRLHFSGYRHPQTQGKVERFHRSMAATMKRRGFPSPEQRQDWLDRFRHEYNHLRPHEALGMKTPATVWRKSVRAYQPHPPAWEYPPGSQLKKIAAQGQIFLEGRRWEISRALAEEWVQLNGSSIVCWCTTA